MESLITPTPRPCAAHWLIPRSMPEQVREPTPEPPVRYVTVTRRVEFRTPVRPYTDNRPLREPLPVERSLPPEKRGKTRRRPQGVVQEPPTPEYRDEPLTEQSDEQCLDFLFFTLTGARRADA